MQQIRFRLGIRPKPIWGSSQRSPKPLSWVLGNPTSKEREGEEGKTGEGRKEVKKQEKVREKKRKGRKEKGDY